MHVFIVHHVHELGDDVQDTKLIGVYGTQEAADHAVSLLSARPGFEDHPDGFSIERYLVDKTHWLEGFVTPEPDTQDSEPQESQPG